MPSAFVPSQVVVQLENDLQPPQWGAPVLLCGTNVVTDAEGKILYQPAYSQRPMSAEEFTDEILEALNHRLSNLGLTLQRFLTEND